MNGIWTYHLIQALQGDVEGALDRDRFITGESLKNYLTVAVPAYIRTNTKIQGAQRPYAILSSNGPFCIRQVPPSDSTKPGSLRPPKPSSCRSSPNADQWEPASDHAVGNRKRFAFFEDRRALSRNIVLFATLRFHQMA